MKRRGSTIAVHTEVDLDAGEVMDELSTEELVEELASRRRAEQPNEFVASREFFEDLLERLRRRDYDEAELLLERWLFPKFKTPEACIESFGRKKAAA